MNARHSMHRGTMMAVLLCLSIGSATGDPPDAQNKADATPEPDQETPVTDTSANELTVVCPCADDFNTAIKIYDARPGTPIRPEPDGCSGPKGGLGKYGVLMSKFDSLTPSEKGRTTNLHMNASRNWTFWGTRPVDCSVWVWTDSQPMTSLLKPSIHKDLSDAELAACIKMVREIAHCQQ